MTLSDATGTIVEANEAFCSLVGYRRDELVGRHFGDITHPEDRVESLAGFAALVADPGSRVRLTNRYVRKDGGIVWAEMAVSPVGQDSSSFVAQIRDVSRERSAKGRAALQAVIAGLGQLALKEEDVSAFTQAAIEQVTRTLGTSHAELLEILPGSEELMVVASVGWRDDAIGRTSVFLAGSHAELALASPTALILDGTNLASLKSAGRLRDVGACSGVIAPLLVSGQPYGILGAYSLVPRTFTTDDLNFIQTVTTLLSSAIERHVSRQAVAEAQHVARLGRWWWDIPTGEVFWSDELYRIFGVDPAAFVPTFESFLSRLHPDDRDRVAETVQRSADTGEDLVFDYRFVRPDGEVRYGHAFARARRVRDRVVRLFGTAQDVTEIKQAQIRMQRLARRLVVLQESERRGIARELHDEVGQILTGLRLMLETGASTGRPADELAADCLPLVEDLMSIVRDMSHSLRPTMLDDLGLLAALQWHLGRYEHRSGIDVAFTHSGLDRRFSPDIETAAYRIVQEALTNVARHARAKKAVVEVAANDGTLEVLVEDDGVGCDLTAARATGSGLYGIEERAVALGGTVIIETEPGAGLRLTARVPVGVA